MNDLKLDPLVKARSIARANDRQRSLDLLEEVEFFVSIGEPLRTLAEATGRKLESLERTALRYGRKDLARVIRAEWRAAL